MNITQINTAILSGSFTSEQLNSITDAVKMARANLALEVKYTLNVGANVSFNNSKTRTVMTGKVTKIATKFATVSTERGLWRVPMSMLKVG